ncbi:MAG: ribonuclease P protein component [Bacteroidetes bacterium]|nr:ribonuclease P protein component [Bacteroidota bacterium]
MANTFHKQERLCSKKQIDLLFSKGKSQLTYPVKIIFIDTPVALQFPAQAMFVVPKRQFKKAHDRNKLKRRMREVYRLNKKIIYGTLQANGKKIIVAFIYVGKKIEEFPVIEKAMLKQITLLG